jgi:integrase
MILVATYTSLHLGELAALTRRDVDLEKATVTAVASASELRDGTRIIGEPKSHAGRRTVSIPASLIEVLARDLAEYAEKGPDGVVFVGPHGGPIRRGNFSVTWRRLADGLGFEGLRFHDLRHTGNTLAAMTGASTKELMSRMGHSSTRAALIYQHATEERERLLAQRLDDMINAART